MQTTNIIIFVSHFLVIAFFTWLLLKSIKTKTQRLEWVRYLAALVCVMFIIAMLRQALKFHTESFNIAPIIPLTKQSIWLLINPIFGIFLNMALDNFRKK